MLVKKVAASAINGRGTLMNTKLSYRKQQEEMIENYN